MEKFSSTRNRTFRLEPTLLAVKMLKVGHSEAEVKGTYTICSKNSLSLPLLVLQQLLLETRSGINPSTHHCL